MNPTPFPSTSSTADDADEEPVTSLACTWNQPRKRKESNMKISEVTFEKHVHGKTKKHKYEKLEDFDPRPTKYHNTANNNLPALLDSIKGQGLCVSLLLDKRLCVQNESDSLPSSSSSLPHLPDQTALNKTVTEFVKSLQVTEEQARTIEQNTIEQRDSPYWFEVRKFRLTSSYFGTIMRRRSGTPVDKLVLRIIRQEQFTSHATEWGINNESCALQAYQDKQRENGHPELVVCKSGFIINPLYPFLGASPDGAVYDPSSSDEPYGFLEIKCPYSQRNVTPIEACDSPGFCCCTKMIGGKPSISLRKEHPYFSQVQGQMGIGQRPWCDFVVHTTKGTEVQRIKFDEAFWDQELLPKLMEFYMNSIAPEIVSPMHALGQPMR